jgi:hypothetical protein
MADPEGTAKLNALLVRLRSAREVDTLSEHDPGCEPVDGLLDWAKDHYTVTHRTVAVCCTKLLNVCGQQDFRTDLRFMRSVLERESRDKKDKYEVTSDMQWKSRNVELTALLWRRMKPALQTFTQTFKTGSPEARASYKLDDQMKAYRNKHMDYFDREHNEWYNNDQLLKTLPDIDTLPN